jgi:hypothetical protein
MFFFNLSVYCWDFQSRRELERDYRLMFSVQRVISGGDLVTHTTSLGRQTVVEKACLRLAQLIPPRLVLKMDCMTAKMGRKPC